MSTTLLRGDLDTPPQVSQVHFEAKQSEAKFKSIFSLFSLFSLFFAFFLAFVAFFCFFRFKFFASLRFSNFCFEAKQSEAKFKNIFSLFSDFFSYFCFFSLNFRFTSIFSLNFCLFDLRFCFIFLVFRIEVNHVKSGFFFASKRNEIFASISNFASEAKVRAHPRTYHAFNKNLLNLYPGCGHSLLQGHIILARSQIKVTQFTSRLPSLPCCRDL
jgi:hypothetical protein